MTPLAILVALTMAATVVPASAGVESGSANDAKDRSTKADREVVLYYFHGAKRCKTCRSIESYARTAVEGKFGEALQSGALTWKVVNIDEPENEHFLTDFDLVGSSLVLVEMDGGEVARHEVLQEVWTLVRDEPRFVEYVQSSVGEYLN
jgi:hypothetical protein